MADGHIAHWPYAACTGSAHATYSLWCAVCTGYVSIDYSSYTARYAMDESRYTAPHANTVPATKPTSAPGPTITADVHMSHY